MTVFTLLADPQQYTAETWNLGNDAAGQEYWLKHFEESFQITMQAARQSLVTDAAGLAETLDQANRDFMYRLTTMRKQPAPRPEFTVFGLDRLRQEILRHYGLQDPFLKIKHQENIQACSQYPRLIKAHERLDNESLVRVLTEGILAGNVFDLATRASFDRYNTQGLDFYHTLDDLPQRPWLVDDYDHWQSFWLDQGRALKRVIIFIDNAGCDFVLGCLPLARVLAQRGATVTLAANDEPCLNDMTLPECKAVLQALAQDDELLGFLLRTGRLRLAGTGNSYPLIDLSRVSPACNTAARGTELLILIGMGRAVETNWNARFTCATLKIAMLKDEWVAQQLTGKRYDVVCRFEQKKT